VTERVSVSSNGVPGTGDSSSPSISADGRFVAFGSLSPNLVVGDTNGLSDAFVRDRELGVTDRVSVSSTGAEADDLTNPGSISADGRYVAFSSYARDLVPGDMNGQSDVFLRDRELGVTEILSLDPTGLPADGTSYSLNTSISADGRSVAFQSFATNLVPGDLNQVADAFVRDRIGGPSFTSLCHPGYDGVIGCPCVNPPSGSGPGCNNQSNTGGAVLSAGGAAYLSFDTLTFTTSGEVPSAMSVLVQGNTFAGRGFAWGQGVRCMQGSMYRFYTKNAVAGSVTVPDFGAGDPPVSARSAALGDTIHPGQRRWYLVYYRDTINACGSFINATQTGEVVWGP
jgi:hypothetical protein